MLVSLHVVVGVVGDSEDVRWQLPDLLVSVQLDLFGCVDREDLVGVDGHENRPCVCLKINSILHNHMH